MTDGRDGRTKLQLYGLPLGSTEIVSYEKMIYNMALPTLHF